MSKIETIKPTTLPGIKRLANQLKKASGTITHHEALYLAAQQAGYDNYASAVKMLVNKGGDK